MDDELKEMPERVQLILKTISNPRRLNVLRALNTKGSLPYSELKSVVGYRTKSESGKFAYHLRQLRKQSLVHTSKNEKQYTITNLGKHILNMVKQVEDRSVVESGQMYVRTSDMAIETFNPDRILQSLVREGGLPAEMAQRVTEDVEGRIRKFETSHLSGPLIRELVNTVLLEMGHEGYRNKMTRLGMPAHDIHEMLTDNTSTGFDDIVMTIGRIVLNEYLLTNILPKDVADMHMRGNIHIGDTAGWSLIPDTLFARAADMLDDSVRWDAQTPHISDSDVVLATTLMRASWEVSGEVVVDGLVDTMLDMSRDRLARVLSSIHHCGANITLTIPLCSDVAGTMLGAYQDYSQIVAEPRIGIVADPGNGDASRFAEELASASRAGGRISVYGGRTAGSGVTDSGVLDTAAKLHSVTINLPRLAYGADRDEKYFRTLLSLRMAPAIAILKSRRKNMLDMTRRGLNPFLKAKIVYDNTDAVQLFVNLAGMQEAISDVMGFSGEEAHRICLNTIRTAADSARKERRAGQSIEVCMVPSGGATRLAGLDGNEYGMLRIPESALDNGYGQGCRVDVKEAIILRQGDRMATEIRETAKLLGGGLHTEMTYDDDAPLVDIVESINRMTSVCGFSLVRQPTAKSGRLRSG